MLRIDRHARTLARLAPTPMAEAALLERADLQRMIRNSAADFFAELGEEMLAVAEEVRPSEVVDDRIDLLALDRDGAAVVVELKRGAHKLQLLQALSYAAMVAEWDLERFAQARATFSGKLPAEVRDEIEEFLVADPAELNDRQRLLLVAEDYDYEVLATAKWLSERHGVEVACWRLEVAADGPAEYLSLSCIYPPPELADAAKRRRAAGGREPQPARWDDWDAALGAVANPAVVRFYRERLAQNWPAYLSRRSLAFEVAGRRRFVVYARGRHAYVRQRGRFDGDLAFWRERLGADCGVGPVADGRGLRLFLATDTQFEGFWRAFNDNIGAKTFHHEPPAGSEPDLGGEAEPDGQD